MTETWHETISEKENLEYKIHKFEQEIKRIQKASEEINKLVKDTQEAVYIFPVDLDDKYKAHILEVLEEALEGREE